ncbi:sigma 54-interacting transcriptional regulator [Myxococcota bacterium]|nr:sigma 54-interacting transcriptional regulator [Myxococcota bacterium]
MAALTFLDRAGAPHRFELKKKLITLGRAPDNDLPLDDPRVLPHHAHLMADRTGYVISSLDPEARIRVNGKERRNYGLKGGDIVALGDTELTFDTSAATGEPRPSAASSGSIPVRAESQGSRDLRFEQLHRFSEKLLQRHSLPILWKTLLDAVIEVTGAGKGFLVILRDGQLEIPAARNVDRVDLEKDPSQLSDSVIARVLKERRPIIIGDAQKDTLLGTARSVVDLKLSSVMCVPLIARDTLMGILYVGSDRASHLFQPEDLDALVVFAAQAGLILHNALLMDELREDNAHLRRELHRGGLLIGGSPPMRAVFHTLERVAPTDIAVLITGETGTGKELVAREIHARSPRADKPFISINCGAIPENLLESELFGHRKGAFTGAVADKVGKFEAADGGTLFLDEIGEMPLSLQVKLLRVLQDHAIERVGEVKPTPVDIRVISATNKDLEAEVAARRFREDLYYRLHEVAIHLPPLRERGDDIALIARHLLKRHAAQYSDRSRGFSVEAIQAMKAYVWPGNVRQLENRIKKAVVMSDGPLLTPEDLGFEGPGEEARAYKPLAVAREEFQIAYIREVLEACGWNKAETARVLDVDARTIFRYIEKFRDE